VDVGVRALRRVPAHLARRVDADGISGAQRIDAFLTEQSRVFPASTTGVLARCLLASLDPDGSERFDPEAYRRRGLTRSVDGTGMHVGRYVLDAGDGTVVDAALDFFAAPAPTHEVGPDGQDVLIADTRTASQRRADALTTIARLALSGAGTDLGVPLAQGS
jgi:hypothetical protein